MLLDMYKTMLSIRAFETKAAECFTKGMLAGLAPAYRAMPIKPIEAIRDE